MALQFSVKATIMRSRPAPVIPLSTAPEATLITKYEIKYVNFNNNNAYYMYTSFLF